MLLSPWQRRWSMARHPVRSMSRDMGDARSTRGRKWRTNSEDRSSRSEENGRLRWAIEAACIALQRPDRGPPRESESCAMMAKPKWREFGNALLSRWVAADQQEGRAVRSRRRRRPIRRAKADSLQLLCCATYKIRATPSRHSQALHSCPILRSTLLKASRSTSLTPSIATASRPRRPPPLGPLPNSAGRRPRAKPATLRSLRLPGHSERSKQYGLRSPSKRTRSAS